MPMRRRGKMARPAGVSALDTTQEHTEELRESLARTGHLLQRPTLRQLVMRILDQPELLGLAVGDGELPPEAAALP